MGESHVTDQYFVAHLIVTILIPEEEIVVTPHREYIIRKSLASLTTIQDTKSCPRHTLLTIVCIECDGEATLWHLRYLPRPLKGAYTF